LGHSPPVVCGRFTVHVRVTVVVSEVNGGRNQEARTTQQPTTTLYHGTPFHIHHLHSNCLFNTFSFYCNFCLCFLCFCEFYGRCKVRKPIVLRSKSGIPRSVLPLNLIISTAPTISQQPLKNSDTWLWCYWQNCRILVIVEGFEIRVVGLVSGT
jgi:hypothetical protein